MKKWLKTGTNHLNNQTTIIVLFSFKIIQWILYLLCFKGMNSNNIFQTMFLLFSSQFSEIRGIDVNRPELEVLRYTLILPVVVHTSSPKLNIQNHQANSSYLAVKTIAHWTNSVTNPKVIVISIALVPLWFTMIIHNPLDQYSIYKNNITPKSGLLFLIIDLTVKTEQDNKEQNPQQKYLC